MENIIAEVKRCSTFSVSVKLKFKSYFGGEFGALLRFSVLLLFFGDRFYTKSRFAYARTSWVLSIKKCDKKEKTWRTRSPFRSTSPNALFFLFKTLINFHDHAVPALN